MNVTSLLFPELLFQDPGLGQPAHQIISQLRTLDFVVNPVVAAALALVLALTYCRTHKGLSYSQSFTQTLLMLSVVIAVVMMAIGSSLSNAFALVGALSIIRFRTVVKDTRDIAFIFASLCIGLTAGTANSQNSHLLLAAIGCAFFVAVALVMYASNFGALYKSEFILRFAFEQARDSSGYLRCLNECSRRANMLHIEPTGDGKTLRLTYDVALEKDATAQKLIAALGAVEGVSDVVLVVSKNDVDY